MSAACSFRPIALLIVTALAACSGGGGSPVFPDVDSALPGMEALRFGDSCADIHARVRGQLPASERDRRPGGSFMMPVSYPTLGSSTAYFDCGDEDDRLQRVRIMLTAHLRDYDPYERALQRLRDRWGEPEREQVRQETPPNARHIRALGGTPQEYELRSATWRLGADTQATLEMAFTWVEIQLFLRFEAREQ